MPLVNTISLSKHAVFDDTYLWHNRLSIIALDITKGHLRALVLVDLQIRMVNVLYLVHGHCAS